MSSKWISLAAAACLCACGHAAPPEDADQVDLAAGAVAADPYPARCGLALLESFETAAAAQAWHAANWASATLDANGQPLPVSRGSFGATAGASALSAGVRFTGAGYEQGYVGREGLSLSLSGCATLAFDVTLPANAPAGLRGSLVLLLGPNGAWNGQADPVALSPGATTTVRLPLAGGIEPVPARDLFKKLVGVGLKIDAANLAWSGSIALDNLRVEAVQPPSADDANAFPVGTFGGFVRSSGPDIPSRNGFLTFTADSTVQGHALRWPKLGAGGGDFLLGTAYYNGTWPSGSTPKLVFHDWSLLEAQQDGSSAFLSRAFPAVRYRSWANTFIWASGMTRMAVVENGAVTVHQLDSEPQIDLSAMSEPWILLWAGPASGWPFDAPVLFTFEKHPKSATQSWDGLHIDFGRSMGRVQVMPLGGLRRRDPSETAGWDGGLPGDVIVQARALVQPLAAFPVSLKETYAIDEASGTATVTDTYSFDSIDDDWGTQPTPWAAIPPAVYHAGLNGYPVQYKAGQPVATPIATWFGPYAYLPGTTSSYTIPLAAALSRSPIAVRVLNDKSTQPIRAELERVLNDEVPNEPGTYWLGNDESDADFLCDSYSTNAPGGAAREKARVTGPRLAENTFLSRSIATFTEPVTGQTYLSPTSYPASIEPFDKEWNTGRQLASLTRCAEAIDLDVARGMWPKLLATYRYHRIFFDWATGSVLSSTQGFTELADGMHFAWDGMLGVGRLARKLGDEATWRDAAYRTARQQLALYNAWYHAQWVKDIDYAVGHISDVKLSADQVETRGAIDGWVEDFGSSTLEFKSFWQTTNYLYFDVPAQLSLYRDHGLESRVRSIEYDIMPSLHPSWDDGNATDPVDQRYYGSNYTSAHLVARALLFHDDPATLFNQYNAPRGSQASNQWYSMYFHGMAGPTLLAIERGHAPLVEAPLNAMRVVSATYDAAANKVALDFQALKTGTIAVRTRKPGGAFRQHPIAVKAGGHYTASFAP